MEDKRLFCFSKNVYAILIFCVIQKKEKWKNLFISIICVYSCYFFSANDKYEGSVICISICTEVLRLLIRPLIGNECLHKIEAGKMSV